MNPHESATQSEWMRALARADSAFEREFWNKYSAPLLRVAERQLSQRLQQRVDPDDVVQSTCRTFFRRVRQGSFDCRGPEDLWRLLVTIALNKARMQARYHGRECRGLDREQSLSTDPSAEPMTNDLSEVDFTDYVESILARFDTEQQEVLTRMLNQQTQGEIAQAMRCSERTVRRLVGRIREQLESFLLGDEDRDE